MSEPIQEPPSPRRYERTVIGCHLILTAYGHWLPNDPRGSGSTEVRQDKFAELGEIHFGRKRVQPPRSELREFYRHATPRLDHEPLWFDDAKRQAIALAFAQVITKNRYTVWGCAILRNHAHLCIRRHRDDPATMWHTFAEESARALRSTPAIPDDHPTWSSRPYKVYLKSPEEVHRGVHYIQQNPLKEGLPLQIWPFIVPYDNWPFHHHPRS